MPGVERIWMPGEQSHGKRQEAERSGIPIGAALRKSLDRIADELGLPHLK